MLWTPDKMWAGQDAYLIGGGNSLRGFDFSLLKGKHTIGINDAFRLGKDIVEFCLFGDASWWHKNKWQLEKFGNPVVTCAPSLQTLNAPWLKIVKRVREGLHDPPKLGWNYSTGGSAINLAIHLGAKRCFLLGFDVSLQDGKSHWHDGLRPANTRDAVFERFLRGFKRISEELPRYDMQVIHVFNGPSKLPWFEQWNREQLVNHLTNSQTERQAA